MEFLITKLPSFCVIYSWNYTTCMQQFMRHHRAVITRTLNTSVINLRIL